MAVQLLLVMILLYLIPGGPNAPNLDDGNLIPVYYDNTNEVWKKADSSNQNNSWYNYENKMWANAVIVSSSTLSTYQSASIDTTITDADIVAFYVWIPRYKYRVWNITRQGDVESTYAYPAYTNGIEIEWENGVSSTGNVRCTYDITTKESETNLSDVCVYNGTDTITTESSNENYTNAWYTHPAFTFNNKEKTGFWIGKFETTGSSTVPTVLPDKQSSRGTIITSQFTSSRVFQKYLSNNMNAHMLTNLEWGAVAYLTHSIYGLCDDTNCSGVYINNSLFYTGRSGGAVSGSADLDLSFVYPKDTTETTDYNTNGYYTYKGYFIDYNGNVTTTKDITKVASTTRNITGVYDMSGGADERVMANMVDETQSPYNSTVSTWDGSSTLDDCYYNAYSYGTNYSGQLAFNRARLGDATAEVLGDTTHLSAWRPGIGLIRGSANFMYNTISWLSRGGIYNSSFSSIYAFQSDLSGGSPDTTFRSSLS